MRKRLVLQPLLHYRSTWPACLVLKATTLLWAPYRMCSLCTVTAPGTSICLAAKWARQINPSHVVAMSPCDTPIANTLSFTLLSLLLTFPACFFTSLHTGHLGLVRLLNNFSLLKPIFLLYQTFSNHGTSFE